MPSTMQRLRLNCAQGRSVSSKECRRGRDRRRDEKRSCGHKCMAGWGEDVQKNLFSPPRFLIIIFIIFSLLSFFSAFFLLAFFPALHITQFYFLFSLIFLPQPVEEADENVSPFPSFFLGKKNGRKIRKKIRCGLIQLYGRTASLFSPSSFFSLSRVPAPNTPSLTSIRLHTHDRCARSLICQPLPCSCSCCC